MKEPLQGLGLADGERRDAKVARVHGLHALQDDVALLERVIPKEYFAIGSDANLAQVRKVRRKVLEAPRDRRRRGAARFGDTALRRRRRRRRIGRKRRAENVVGLAVWRSRRHSLCRAAAAASPSAATTLRNATGGGGARRPIEDRVQRRRPGYRCRKGGRGFLGNVVLEVLGCQVF